MNCRLCCWLFCCPPCPSNITNKLAFLPPSPPSYVLHSNPDTTDLRMSLLDSSINWAVPPEEVFAQVKVHQMETRRGNRIVCVFIPYVNRDMSSSLSPPSSIENTKTIFHSHGNAVDLGPMVMVLFQLGQVLGVNVATYDYSGYGLSTGRASEKNLKDDAHCALTWMKEKYKIPLENVILYGQSIGSVPTMFLASNYSVGGVVLHSPFSSGLRLLCRSWNIKRSLCCDPFKNIDLAPKISSLTLVIHGTDDDVVPVSHAYAIQSKLPNPVNPPLIIEGAFHDNCDAFPEFYQRLYDFIYSDIIAYGSSATLSDVC